MNTVKYNWINKPEQPHANTHWPSFVASYDIQPRNQSCQVHPGQAKDEKNRCCLHKVSEATVKGCRRVVTQKWNAEVKLILMHRDSTKHFLVNITTTLHTNSTVHNKPRTCMPISSDSTMAPEHFNTWYGSRSRHWIGNGVRYLTPQLTTGIW